MNTCRLERGRDVLLDNKNGALERLLPYVENGVRLCSASSVLPILSVARNGTSSVPYCLYWVGGVGWFRFKYFFAVFSYSEKPIPCHSCCASMSRTLFGEVGLWAYYGTACLITGRTSGY
jgi:hypothetical protein